MNDNKLVFAERFNSDTAEGERGQFLFKDYFLLVEVIDYVGVKEEQNSCLEVNQTHVLYLLVFVVGDVVLVSDEPAIH